MTIDVRHVGSCSVVRVEDRFDAPFARWLGHALNDLAGGRATTAVIVDLTDVSPVQPAAMAALWATLDVGDLPVAIVNQRLSARRIVRRWGGKRLLVYPTLPMAVEALASTAAAEGGGSAGGFRHEAFLYAGTDELVTGVSDFVRAALAAEEPVLVAVGAAKTAAIREELGADAETVTFGDMEQLGRNPARILPAWLDFVAAHQVGDRRVRGVGEPIWSGRSAAELVESQHHEALLNVAFADSPTWWLLCPYDTASLGNDVLDAARRSHPLLLSGGVHEPSDDHLDDPWPVSPFEGPLPPPIGREVAELAFDATSLRGVASFVARHADEAGLRPEQVRDLARAVTEVATNSVIHGGGSGHVRIWWADGAVIGEVRDAGHITEPLLGRVRPQHGADAERGLWLANQLCDLVQIRSSAEDGTVVRLHVVAR